MIQQSHAVEVRRSESRSLSGEALDLYERAVGSIEVEEYEEATLALHRAASLAPENARIRSLLGLSIAHHEKDFQQARSLCESAAQQEFFNPDLYLHLASVYLVFGRRAEAMRYLRRGQMIDPGHTIIAEFLGELGRRRSAVIPFLPRRHPINRALGGALSLISATFSRSRV
jgi:Flp pilus assembly protein TadD